jgi:hypothetical protein
LAWALPPFYFFAAALSFIAGDLQIRCLFLYRSSAANRSLRRRRKRGDLLW